MLVNDKLGMPSLPRPASPNRRYWHPPSKRSRCSRSPRPFLIGERLNTQGSQKFKQIILDEDYDAILSIARQQVE